MGRGIINLIHPFICGISFHLVEGSRKTSPFCFLFLFFWISRKGVGGGKASLIQMRRGANINCYPSWLVSPRTHSQSIYDEVVLVGIYLLLEPLQRFALLALTFPRHDELSPVSLDNLIVDHEARLVALELARLEVLVNSLDGAGSVVPSCDK